MGSKGSKTPPKWPRLQFSPQNFWSIHWNFLKLSKKLDKVDMHIYWVLLTLERSWFCAPGGQMGKNTPQNDQNCQFYPVTFDTSSWFCWNFPEKSDQVNIHMCWVLLILGKSDFWACRSIVLEIPPKWHNLQILPHNSESIHSVSVKLSKELNRIDMHIEEVL